MKLPFLCNSIFSMSSGLTLLFAPFTVSAWLGINAPLTLRIIGLLLLIFGASLLQQALQDAANGPRALLIVALDASWVIGSVALLLVFPSLLSSQGAAIVLSVALIVGFFALWQWSSIADLYRLEGDTFRLCIAVQTPTTSATMWTAVSALGEIQRYMPSLRSSKLLNGARPGVGACRVCEAQDGATWSEQCTRWEEGRSFDVTFDTQAEGFPFPFSSMRGGWIVEPAPSGSVVRIWWGVTPKHLWLSPLLFPSMELLSQRDFRGVVGRMSSGTLHTPTSRLLVSRC